MGEMEGSGIEILTQMAMTGRAILRPAVTFPVGFNALSTDGMP